MPQEEVNKCWAARYPHIHKNNCQCLDAVSAGKGKGKALRLPIAWREWGAATPRHSAGTFNFDSPQLLEARSVATDS